MSLKNSLEKKNLVILLNICAAALHLISVDVAQCLASLIPTSSIPNFSHQSDLWLLENVFPLDRCVSCSTAVCPRQLTYSPGWLGESVHFASLLKILVELWEETVQAAAAKAPPFIYLPMFKFIPPSLSSSSPFDLLSLNLPGLLPQIEGLMASFRVFLYSFA